jgi:predicted ATPase
VDAVRQLIRKSLVVRIDLRRGSPRFGMHETLREYAMEKLQLRGTERMSVRERHAAYYTALVQRLDPAAPTTLMAFSGEGEELTAPVFEVLEDIHDNVGVALRWWLDAGRATEALVLLRALGPLWLVRGVSVEGRSWIEAVLDLAASDAETVPQALHAQALIYSRELRRAAMATSTRRVASSRPALHFGARSMTTSASPRHCSIWPQRCS